VFSKTEVQIAVLAGSYTSDPLASACEVSEQAIVRNSHGQGKGCGFVVEYNSCPSVHHTKHSSKPPHLFGYSFFWPNETYKFPRFPARRSSPKRLADKTDPTTSTHSPLTVNFDKITTARPSNF
jgi:hypothetical protein